jgi:hypothetical protein
MWVAIVIPSGYSLLGCAAGYVAGTLAFAAASFYLIGPDLKRTITSLRATVRLVIPTASR